MKIHKTAIVAEEAQIDKTAIIGPYCVIGPQVKISKDVKRIQIWRMLACILTLTKHKA